MGEEVSFTATGDSFITRRLPVEPSLEFEKVSKIILESDFRFTNFEMTTPEEDGIPSAVSGGTWARAKPEVVKDLKKYGFNCVAWANNHTLDYLYTGLSKTKKQLESADFIHAGAGENLAEASSPKYIETKAGRIALIAATSTFHETWIAGEQRKDLPGRPGVNGLRHISQFKVNENDLLVLKEVAKKVGINASRNLDILEGFLPKDKDGEVVFGHYRFVESSHSELKRILNKIDMDRIINTIHEAKRQADYVIVSLHSHEMQGEDKQLPADFIEEASRIFIDEGAHAVLGHGPHIVRGIEIYKKRPIFYSLGNFIFQNDTVEVLPSDFYEKYNLSKDSNVADGMDMRSKNNTIGLSVNPLVWESIIPCWKMKDGELTELILHPIDLGYQKKRYQKGWPVLSSEGKGLRNIQDLSKVYGTSIDIKNGIGVVKI
ncbi:CapA family protein [Planococcus sp. CPCC 101016]|uniref:CapA family protein n=1 Tax=Planococcus sp. CPCC 101016 TaxID=2599617 RepID=UPI0011B49EBD|nr:CapA family protein [Planococcus sp. CPCC 101016]TWT06566.1 CapA family protein [Planococcus sp. CPCC 101016]